jgi:hypothetical protein
MNSGAHPCGLIPAIRDEVEGETTEHRAIRLLEELCARLAEDVHGLRARVARLEGEVATLGERGRG